MKIKHLSEDGWQQVHNGTVLFQTAFEGAEIRAPFHIFWTKMEAGTEMEVGKGHPESELFIIIRGTGKVTVGTEECEVKEGDAIYAPPRAAHWFKNDSTGELHVIGVKYLEIDENPKVS